MHRITIQSAVITSTAALLATTALTSPAIAQDSDAPARTGGVERIVVTAERREGLLQETPVTVSAFTADTLEDLQVDTTQDIQRLVPGLKMIDNVSSPTNFTISLRGSTQQDASLVVAESPVGIYVDDIYIARLNGANAQLADIDRVEVLRGPQGTLYGRNTLAGALKIVTATPGQEHTLRAQAGIGDYGRYRVSGAVSGPLGDSGWAASFAGLADGMDGYFTNLATGEDTGMQDNTAVRAKLAFDDGGPLTASAFASLASSSNDGYQPSFALFPAGGGQVRSGEIAFGLGDPYVVNVAPNPALPAPIRSLPAAETDQTIIGVEVAYDLGWATARSITGYVHTDDFFSVEFTGVGGFSGANRSDTSQWSQELQLLGTSLDDRLEWIAGVYAFTEEADQVVALVTDDLLRIETDSIAAFAQGSYAFTDRLTGTLGLRWTEDDKSFEGTIRSFGTLAPIFPTVMLDDTYEALTPKFGIDYQAPASGPFDSLLLYATAAKGFKSGGYNGIAFGNIDVLNTAYSPEENWTYEIGAKADLFDSLLRVNTAAYFNEITDIALNAQSTGPGGVSFPVQTSGDAEISGLEIELVAQPTPALNLFANLTLQDAKYTRLTPGSNAATAQTLFGDAKPAQVPEYAYTIGASYTFDAPFTGSDAITIGADYFYTDEFFIAVGNDFIIDAYGRTNAYVAYHLNEQWEARLSAANLEDDVDIISGAAVFSAVTVAPPRTVLFNLSYAR